MAVTSLPAPLAIKGSARNRQDVRLTGRSPIQAGHARNRPIPITGRSIGASLADQLHFIWSTQSPFKASHFTQRPSLKHLSGMQVQLLSL